MPTPKQVIRVFIGSPGDVSTERKQARAAIDRLNSLGVFEDCILESIAWESDAHADVASKTPQDNINDGLRWPSRCDISVFIFWSRIGTELATGLPDDRRAELGFADIPLTGSVWELCDERQEDEADHHSGQRVGAS